MEESSTLKFNLQELPNGRSHRTVNLGHDDLELDEEVKLQEAAIELNFYKTDHFVDVTFNLTADIELICDRSLRPFTKKLNSSYHVLFDPNPVEPSETEKGAVRQIPADVTVDISKEVRDTLMLEIPFRKIHPDYLDKEGNPADFKTVTFGQKTAGEEKIDPRWAALKKLKNN